eukprot:6198240-Pleurochrysis_carterae.AAC.3
MRSAVRFGANLAPAHDRARGGRRRRAEPLSGCVRARSQRDEQDRRMRRVLCKQRRTRVPNQPAVIALPKRVGVE